MDEDKTFKAVFKVDANTFTYEITGYSTEDVEDISWDYLMEDLLHGITLDVVEVHDA